jgi:hypothetical protein
MRELNKAFSSQLPLKQKPANAQRKTPKAKLQQKPRKLDYRSTAQQQNAQAQRRTKN